MVSLQRSVDLARKIHSTQTKFRNKKLNSSKSISDVTESKLHNNFTFKTYINLLSFMLSRTLGIMFNVKQLFTINYPLLLNLTLFFVHFNSFEVICSQSLKVSKSYQNNKVTSIKKRLRVPNSFSHYCEITYSILQNSSDF